MDVDFHLTVKWSQRLFTVVILSIFASLPGSNRKTETVTLALLGDVMLGRGVAEQYTQNWGHVFEAIAPVLKEADISLANLESPIGERSTAGNPTPLADGWDVWNLCAPLSSVEALSEAGIDVLTLANNHNMDCEDGWQGTQDALEKEGLMAVSPDYDPLTITANGIDLAVFAFDDVSQLLDIEAAVGAVERAKQVGAVVIVSIHWGLEYHPGPEERQLRIAEQLVHAGASLIWGHHPHVLQQVVWLESSDGSQNGLVAYSLGNGVFDQSPPDTRRTVMMVVNLDRTGVETFEWNPMVIEIPSWRTIWADDEIGKAICKRGGLTSNDECVIRMTEPFSH
jgi:poly-gamma-glutamate synthesis protein (capsule biosynthesis protein)